MSQFLSMLRYAVAATILISLGAQTTASAQQPMTQLPKPEFNAKGELLRPDTRYREWVYIGTPLTPHDMNDGKANFPEFHNVYIHPADFAHWKKHGSFPDQTVIVKELVLVGSKQAVSGAGYFMGNFTGLEVTIKDSKRFKSEPGFWAYFSFGHSYPLADTAQAFPTESCNACHESSAKDDFVFTQYYPVLRAAKGKRSGRAMTPQSKEFMEIAAAMKRGTAAATKSTAETPSVKSTVPTDAAALFKYLQNGEYKKFKAQESDLHPSAGPHAKFGLPVRVFMDPTLAASLKAGYESHPAGSSIVKEMYDAGKKLLGWAVMVKTNTDSKGGKGWFWYEVTSTTDGSDPVAVGNGVPLCSGCHGLGKDHVLTKTPLK